MRARLADFGDRSDTNTKDKTTTKKQIAKTSRKEINKIKCVMNIPCTVSEAETHRRSPYAFDSNNNANNNNHALERFENIF